MKNLILLELHKLRFPIIFTLILGMIASVVLCSTIYKSYALEHQLEVWEVGFTFFNFTFPLVAVLPTCWLLYFERKNEFVKYTLPRTSKRKYLFSKWIVIAGSASLIMFCISFIGVVTALYIIPPIEIIYGWISPDTDEPAPSLIHFHFAAELFLEKPLLYGLLLSIWKGLVCGVVATMGFGFSLFSRNLFVILTGPFIYMLLDNYLMQMLAFDALRLYVAFEPTSELVENISILSFLVGPMLALL
ncbi:hypothetical protein F9U64_07980 [Gracilibacillus oryzae]|uniref:Uncharacterized protein n=1 Tax=Gracilibacillus oryzae TaxID=1672701 RepID=A0A7C8GTV5_9BACI|nr:hypothetical protein [Gracilibacillus oryzae]KAB8137735.1 hypothetical protein F9U64_07980 [Gracilibacillus oryzae]